MKQIAILEIVFPFVFVTKSPSTISAWSHVLDFLYTSPFPSTFATYSINTDQYHPLKLSLSVFFILTPSNPDLDYSLFNTYCSSTTPQATKTALSQETDHRSSIRQQASAMINSHPNFAFPPFIHKRPQKWPQNTNPTTHSTAEICSSAPPPAPT